MNGAHTPGPWFVEKDSDGLYLVVDGQRDMDPIYIDQSAPANREANAFLVAAAPDLLAACQSVAGVFQDSEHPPLYARKCIAAVAKIKPVKGSQ